MPRGEYDLIVGEAQHKGDCLAYAIAERDRLGRFDPARARSPGHSGGTALGPDPQGRIRHASATAASSRRRNWSDRRVPVAEWCTRAIRRHSPGITELARDADLLIHEATFGEDERERARETGHSTAREAATVAREAGVKRLVLTHISARYTREAPELVAEAREIFAAVEVARDGLVVEVPYSE